MAKLLEGKPIAEKIKELIRQKILRCGKKVTLASVQVGNNPAAESYIKMQKRSAELLGVDCQLHKLGAQATDAELIGYIEKLNNDPQVNGIIVQMPLPAHIDYRKISGFISEDKDVEGVHPANMGRIVFGTARFLPCTASAVMELLSAAGVELAGKETVIVGHSEIVGKPLSLMLLEKLATVTVCHIGTSRAGKLEEHVRAAEVLIVAAGRAGLIKGEWIREGAVVIDVGINRVNDRIVGDVEFAEAAKRASWITPVPGGVGPLTVTMLMRNLAEAAKL